MYISYVRITMLTSYPRMYVSYVRTMESSMIANASLAPPQTSAEIQYGATGPQIIMPVRAYTYTSRNYLHADRQLKGSICSIVKLN